MVEAPEGCHHGASTSGRPPQGHSGCPHPRSYQSLGTTRVSRSVCFPRAADRIVGEQSCGRRCRLRWARCKLGRVRLPCGLAPPCLTSLPQLALLLVVLPALLQPNSLPGLGFLEHGIGGIRVGGEGAGSSGARSRAPLAGAAAQAQPNVTNLGASAWLLMGGTVENYTDPGTVPSQQCGPRYSGMVEFAAAGCNKHEYKPGLFRMLMDAHHRQLGQSALGDRGRLLAALQRYRDGDNLTVAVIGGSIAAGQGAFDAPAFPYWLKLILEAQLPGGPQRVRMNNGAVPGTSSAYMSTCHNVHVPANADIVILDYAVNDEEMPMPHMNNGVRRPFERLIRKLLQYPRRPAVVLMHAYRWFQIPVENTGQFWVSSERQHGEFGSYYGLQQLSVKACCYHLMREGADGFAVKRPRADHHGRLQHENFVDAMLKGRAFYFDIVHPDGNTGHRVMGELAAQLILDAWAQVASGYNVSAQDVERINKPLPPPMLAHNQESRSDKCFIGPALQQTVVSRQGFEWINEGKTAKLPKWGYIAETPGAEIKFKVNTNSTAIRRQELTVELGYLRSYENMGKAAVSCEGGCKCTPWTLDGHHDQRNTQTFLHGWRVSQAEDCVIVVRVLEASNSGKHKVKISGLMVSEDPENLPFNNWAAWDWVSVASSKDPSGVFEIKNVARRSLLAAHQASSARLQQRYAALYGAGGGLQQQRQDGAWEEAEWAPGEQAAGLQPHADGLGSAGLRGV